MENNVLALRTLNAHQVQLPPTALLGGSDGMSPEDLIVYQELLKKL